MSEQGFSLTERDPSCQEGQENRRRVVPVSFGSGGPAEHEARRHMLVVDPRAAQAQAVARRFARTS